MNEKLNKIISEEFESENISGVPKPTLLRLPGYLQYLVEKKNSGTNQISATTIGNDLNLYYVQVRKDLASIGAVGKPKIGYDIKILIHTLVTFLDYHNKKSAVLVGAGKLGRTLLSYDGFANYGLDIVAAVDVNSDLCGCKINDKPVLRIDELANLCTNLKIEIGILTVPDKNAQEAADMLIKCGVHAIWNFSSVHLNVPDDVIVQNENMAASLAVLSTRLAEKMNRKSEI